MTKEYEDQVIQLLIDSYDDATTRKGARVAALLVAKDGEIFTGYRGQHHKITKHKRKRQ